MATDFRQTDSSTGACTNNVYCTGAGSAGSGFIRIASEGGTAGTTAFSPSLAASANNVVETTLPDAAYKALQTQILQAQNL